MSTSIGHKARKRFGQNFLQDFNIIDRILNAIKVSDQDHVIEIGPGLGALSEGLFQHAKQFKVIEIDNDLIPKLEKKFTELSHKFEKNQEHWEIIHQDALTVNLSDVSQSGKLRVVGNLPYNISTPLLFCFIEQLCCIEDMHFMLQKEVVERICSEPNQKSYGRLSVMLQYYCQCENLFNVPPESFTPQPKVDSAIVRLTPYQEPPHPCLNLTLLSQLVTQAFSQRRKTLRNNLKTLKIDNAIRESGIDASLRPENIAVAEYVKLCNIMHQSNIKIHS